MRFKSRKQMYKYSYDIKYMPTIIKQFERDKEEECIE
jgi:hypothetical protein